MLKGVYVFLIMIEIEMIVVFDLNGFRLLFIGMLGDVYVVVLEICVFDVVGVMYFCEVELGEMLIINDEGMKLE